MVDPQELLANSPAGPLSYLLADAAKPARLGTLLALHGGGMRARYWDAPHDPNLSLMRTAADAGWRVFAVDRPGYGASRSHLPRGSNARDQAALIKTAFHPLVGDDPIVLVGHSLGTIVAAHCITDGWDEQLRGAALGGAPLAYPPEQLARFDTVDTSGPAIRYRGGNTAITLETWFGPDGTWDPAVKEHFPEVMAPNPSEEFDDAQDAPAILGRSLGQARIPVQICVGEHEGSTAPAPTISARARKVLHDVPAAEVRTVPGGAHNLSLNHTAPLYHRMVLDFAEAALRRRKASTGG